MISFNFKPKILTTLKNYSKEMFISDLMAGIIVGIVALPLAIAFGIASGVTPEKGIITAIIAGFIISLLGGSKVQIGGPTGAFIVIIYGIVQDPKYGVEGLIIATLLAGVFLVLLGVFKLGSVIKFIPYPIIVGFTSGIAVTIFTTQIKDALGLDFGGQSMPGDFIGKWILYFKNIESINWANTLVTLVSLAIIILTPKYFRRIPGPLVAIIIVTLVVYLLREYGEITIIDNIGDRFTIKPELPDAETPHISWLAIKEILPIAITIALLGAIESLLSATVADGVIGDRHDSNTELIAQGIANMVVPIFGGIPATGAIARTMTNINNGGRTPVAGIIHAIVLLLILLIFMPLAKYIPMACLAAILIMVAYNMSEWRTFIALFNNPRSDIVVLLTTFILTVIFDLTIAIEVGLVIACLFFMRRVAQTTDILVIKDEIDINLETDIQSNEEVLVIPKRVEVYEIDGPYFFGIANKFEEQMINLNKRPIVRIIRMRRVPFIDSTGIYNLANLVKLSRKERVTIILSGVNEQVQETLEKANFYELIGRENVCSNINDALALAEKIVQQKMEEKAKAKEEKERAKQNN